DIMIRIDGKQICERSVVGGKGHYMSVLMSLGLRAPETIALPNSDQRDEHNEAIDWLESLHPGCTSWSLAIRSSSAAEDSTRESKAGHFLTRLGEFGKESLAGAMESVRASGPSMSVLIQPLIKAEFAGVAFSCDPLTFN